MKFRNWVLKLTLITCILCSPFIYIASYNFFIDPLWNFNHSNKYNQYQEPFDERQLKTNMITSNTLKYEALIMGTSRSTYINQNDFRDLKTFNYSASSMHINEYNDYIEYAKKRNGGDFKVIFLEVFPKHLDFPKDYDAPLEYIKKANIPFYKFKSLFSFDTYEKAKNNYMLSNNPSNIGNRSYNRENVAITKIVDSEERKVNINSQLEIIAIPEKNSYVPEYRGLLQEIKDNNPNTRFILYSPPYLTERFLKEFDSEVGYEIYQDWLKDCISVFGDVYNFMYINTITENELNYFDSHHFYPHVGTIIAHKVIGYDDSTIPVDFGVLVNKNNIDDHLRMVRSQLQKNNEFGLQQ